MSQKINILSTKTLTSAQKQSLVKANLNVFEADFIQTENTKFQLENVGDNLIFTSQNAVLSVLNNPEINKLKQKNVFCVGLKTKELLNENGFKVEAHSGYAEDLAEIISLVYADESFTFLSGNIRKDTLPEILTENNVNFNEITVYETNLLTHKIKDTVEAILFFSPSAVKSYLRNNKITNEKYFCIGLTTAQYLESILPETKIKNIKIANQSTIESVIEQVINYYNK